MRCPNCGTELADGSLYCEKCGEDIHIVPDYDTKIDLKMDSALEKIGNQIGEDYPKPWSAREGHNSQKGGSAQNVRKKTNDQNHSKGKNPKGEKARLYCLLGVLACLCGLSIFLTYATQVAMKRDGSPQYQMEQAEKYYARGEYDRAITCYARAMELQGEDILLLEKMSDLFFLKNDQTQYEATLRRILFSKLATEEQIKNASEKLIGLFIKKGDFDAVNQLLLTSEDQSLREKYVQYLAPEPILELAEGTYEGLQSLRISCEGTGKIYYTLDGTIPGENTAEYTLPIILDYGEVTVRACLINEYGIKSKIAKGVYQINRPLEIPE